MADKTDIKGNILRVMDKIALAAERSGRAPEEITLVAASKQNDYSAVRQAYDAGIKVFGENRVQELTEKNAQNAYDGAKIHLIGHLQKNKVKNVVGVCDLIQSVDSEALMKTISDRAVSSGIKQDILIEVNIGGEESKSGIDPAQLDEFAAKCASFPGIFLRGLMAIPPKSENSAEIRNYFDAMYRLYVDIKQKKYDNTDIYVLSMGMSGDFEEAILSGSNMVRVGSSIFGPRSY